MHLCTCVPVHLCTCVPVYLYGATARCGPGRARRQICYYLQTFGLLTNVLSKDGKMLAGIFICSTLIRNTTVKNNTLHCTSWLKVASFNIPPTFSVRKGSHQGVTWNTNYKSRKLYIKKLFSSFS